MTKLRIALTGFAVVALACGGSRSGGPATSAEAGPDPAPQAAEAHAEHGGSGHGEGHEHGQGHAPLGHRFERAEDWAPRFDNADRDEWQRPADVVAAMAIEPGMTVADLGAGTGYFLPHLAGAVGAEGRVLGLDIEPDMVRYMTDRAEREGWANVEARVVATDDPKLAAGSVDRILIVNTWHHIPAREEYARTLRAALAKGGAVVVVDYKLESERGPPRGHKLPPETVTKELRAAGFTVSVDDKLLPDQYIVTAK